MVSLPDALKPAKFPRVGNMTVSTVVLEPQIAANNFVRYVLERRGILDSNSVLTFALKVTNNAASPCTLPVNTGIGALIKNCTLRLGNQVISRTQDWAKYHTLATLFAMPEERSLKHVVTRGSLSTLRPSLVTDGHLSLRDAKYTSSAAAVTPPEIDLTKDPIFMVKLSDLFPALKDVNLPLGHMEDHMVIELELNSQGNDPADEGTLGTFSGTYDQDYSITPDYSQMSMLADHLQYADETHRQMEDLVNGDGLVIPFHEVVTLMSQIPAVADPGAGNVVQQPFVQELPLSGRTVKGVLGVEMATGNTMSGHYRFQSPNVSPGYNLRVNDLQVYPRDVKDPSYKQTELEKVFRRPYAANIAQYSLQVKGAGGTTNPTAANPNEIIGGGGHIFLNGVTGGAGYAAAPTAAPAVIIDPPPAGGTRATAVATVVGGAVTLVTLTDRGTGYVTAPPVAIAPAPAGGTDAEFTAGIVADRPLHTFNGRKYDLEGSSYVEGIDLTNDPISRRGTDILDKPIRYERNLTRTSEDYGSRDTRVFCLVEKAFAIRGGAISVMA